MIEERAPRRRMRSIGLLAAGLAAMMAAPVSTPALAQADELRAVPAAECGADDRTETMQGRTTLAERFAPGEAQAFNCNLVLKGHFPGEGAGWGMNAVGNCVYLSTYRDDRRSPLLQNPGTAVLDVSDSANPRLVTMLTSPAMQNVNESLEPSRDGRLLFGNAYPFNQETEHPIELYDISDCTNPKLLSSVVLPSLRVHGGAFSPDGTIYYGASCCGPYKGWDGPPSALYAIDVSDPANPKEITRWIPDDANWSTHWLSLSPDGKRIYLSLIENAGFRTAQANGIVILDVSDIEARAPDAQFKVVNDMLWDDTGFGEYNLNFTKDGRTYVLHTDMTGSQGFPGGVGSPSTCIEGVVSWGYARVIDVTDEQNPQTVLRLPLEVQMPQNCADIAYDPVLQGGYSAAFCDLDSMVDPKMMACGYMEAGLRVFDIRDFGAAKEIGYFKPAATRTDPKPASPHLVNGQFPINTADSVVVPRFRDGGREIWFNAMDNGFMTVRFSDAFIAANAALFAQ